MSMLDGWREGMIVLHDALKRDDQQLFDPLVAEGATTQTEEKTQTGAREQRIGYG